MRRSCAGLRYECSRQTATASTPATLQLAHALAHLVVVERSHDVPRRRRDALVDAQAVPPLDQRMALPGQLAVQREVQRPLVPSDVEDVAHALGGDKPDGGAPALKHDVRGNGRPVKDGIDVRQRDARGTTDLCDALDRSLRRVLWCRGDLVHRDASGLLVDEDQVGERSADVDADALHASSCGSRGRAERRWLARPGRRKHR